MLSFDFCKRLHLAQPNTTDPVACFAGAAVAVDPQIIALKDHGKIVIGKKGTMIYIDAAGNRVKTRVPRARRS